MKKIFILVPFTIIMQFSFAQKQPQELIDSLTFELTKVKADTAKVSALNALGKAWMRNNDSKKALGYYNQALTLSKKINDKTGEGNALHNIGFAIGASGDMSAQMKFYNDALKLRQEINDQKGIAATYNNMGIAFKSIGNYSEALKMAFAALKINESIHDTFGIARNYNNIGLLYWAQNEYTEALKIYSKALNMLEKSGNAELLNHPYNNMAGISSDMGNYTDALKYNFISLKYREQLGDKHLIADSHTGIGIAYQRSGKFDEAIAQFRKALTIFTELGDTFSIAGIYASFGEVNMLQNKFTEAGSFFNKAMELYKKTGDPSDYSYIFEDLMKTDSAASNYKRALQNYKTFIQYRDSSINQENAKKLVQTQMQYDFDKKETAAKAEQDIKDAIAQKELQKQKLVRNGFVGGFTVVLLFAGVFFTQRNKIKKGKKRSDELLLNILPSEVAEELKEKGSADAKHFDEVTVLFTDFKNFTSVSERLSAQELVNEINFCYSAFDKIISKYRIEKIKTIGDSYMCAGGLPVANKTNAEDTVKTAIEIRDFMLGEKEKREAEGKTFFDIRIGIHTGPVVAGIVGIKKFAYDIWGDTVNIASRMESSGEAGKVNISGTTYDLVKDKFKCGHRGKIQAKNKGEIDMYFVENKI